MKYLIFGLCKKIEGFENSSVLFSSVDLGSQLGLDVDSNRSESGGVSLWDSCNKPSMMSYPIGWAVKYTAEGVRPPKRVYKN